MVAKLHSNPGANGPRLIAIVGPFQSGKTTLLESLVTRAGGLARQGNVRDGSSLGDATPEARAHAMSVEANIATADYLGERYTFIDCPGSIEFAQESQNCLAICDAAIVVCEADPRKIPALQLVLRFLEEHKIPRFLFLNKIDGAMMRVRETLAMLQPASRAPLLLRQIPIWQNGIAAGFIDLALERAFVYREHAPSTVVDVDAGDLPRERDARYSMLERLADYDDTLMEELINDIDPPRDQIFDNLAKDLQEGLAVPLLIGSADRGNGVTRLWKALRHETKGIELTRARLGVADDGPPLAHAIRTIHTAHGGKLTLARVLRGRFVDGGTIYSIRKEEDRISGISRLMGSAATKLASIGEGDTAAFGRLDHIATGESFSDNKSAATQVLPLPEKLAPVQAFALAVKDRKDEVRLTGALAKLCEEDGSLIFTHDTANGEMRLHGQGDMHLRVALEKLSGRYGVEVDTRPLQVRYRETIRHPVNIRGRHKKQSGGHGQFGDVALTITPMERGAGFAFSESVHGGTVPRQYFSSVEIGAQDALARGPLGFPVVDISVTLTDGSYHSVDSSDMAFRAAAKLAVQEGLPKATPILLEPIMAVSIVVPSEALSKATTMISTRRGQILGFDGKPGWEGWDVLQALIPEAEMSGLIVELRSATAGVGTFTASFDHMSEMLGKAAEAVRAS